MFRVGIVGHRYLANAETVSFVVRQSAAVLKQAKTEHQSIAALSAIAEGSDTLFAEAALALDIPLEIVRPFNDYASDFETLSSRTKYENLRAVASRETKLIYRKRSNLAYKAAMNWIVNNSDVLVVAWDGREAEGEGGTRDAVKQAVKLNMHWWHLDVRNLSVTVHTAKQKMTAGKAN